MAQQAIATVEPTDPNSASGGLVIPIPVDTSGYTEPETLMAAVRVTITSTYLEIEGTLVTPIALTEESGIITSDQDGEILARFSVEIIDTPDRLPARETTYLARVFGLAEDPVEITVHAEGPEGDHLCAVHTAVAETVSAAHEDADLVAIAPIDDGAVGVVIPTALAHLPTQQAVSDAVAEYTILDLGIDRIEEHLRDQL